MKKVQFKNGQMNVVLSGTRKCQTLAIESN
jgi:hypothetical protein